MKKCQNCSYENPDAMNFCMQCGAALPSTPQTSGNMRTNADTQPFQVENPTVISNQQKTFAVNQPNFNPNANIPPQPPKKSNTKWFVIIGGVLVLLVLGGIGIVAIVGIGILSSMNDVGKVTPTPVPTRPITVKTPTPVPSINPINSPNPVTSPTVKSPNAPSGKYDSMKVDFDVTEGGKRGMRVSVNFWTYNLKATDCYLAVYFQDENGNKLKSSTTGFASEQGNLALFVLLRPNYDETVYKDMKVFMPYEEIKVPAGYNKLKLDVDLIDKPGNLIEHLNLYDFSLTKN